LGILLSYDAADDTAPSVTVPVLGAPPRAGVPAVSVIGAGNYARRFLLPALRAAGAQLETLVSSGSTLSAWAARRSGFARISTDAAGAIAAVEVSAVVIATR